MLQLELENFQNKGQGRDHKKVYEILRTQRELKRMMNELAKEDGTDEDHWGDSYIHYHW